jgi:RNA polymerase sigma factor (sigma-70 family)
MRGDEAAFADLYERHHQSLYRYCRSILHDDEDARDALQSTMASAFAALQHEERDFEVRPWLFRIAHNESVSLLRRRRRVAPLDSAATVSDDSLAAGLEMRERLAQLVADLRALPERQRAALVLRELSGLSHDEIAAFTGGSTGGAKQMIFEARRGLQECAEGREMACADVQRALSDGDGRVLRGRRIRAHLRGCRACRQFNAALAQRPADLALIAPPLPAAAGSALLAGLIPGALAGKGGVTAVASASGALTTKLVVLVAVTATAAGGTVAATRGVREERAVHHESHQTERAPRQATDSDGSSYESGRAGAGVIDRAIGPRKSRHTLDRPAQQSHAAAEAPSPRSGPSPTPPVASDSGRSAGPVPPAASRGNNGKMPPGQAKKPDPVPKPAPPGQAKKPDPVPKPASPGQAKKPDPVPKPAPPGQAEKAAAAATPTLPPAPTSKVESGSSASAPGHNEH